MERLETLIEASSPGPWRPLVVLLALALGALYAADLAAEHEVQAAEDVRRTVERLEREHRRQAARAFGHLAEAQDDDLGPEDRAWLRGYAAGLTSRVEGQR